MCDWISGRLRSTPDSDSILPGVEIAKAESSRQEIYMADSFSSHAEDVGEKDAVPDDEKRPGREKKSRNKG